MKTILLVDDDIDLLHSVAEILRLRGYSVFECSNPGDALECCRRNQDLTCVLTDIDMPGMDGISLLAEIRRIRPLVEPLLMTGNVDHWEFEPSEEVHCLRKPFSYDELFEALDNCTNLIN
jgi:DNA-binding NtrC family response regulator